MTQLFSKNGRFITLAQIKQLEKKVEKKDAKVETKADNPIEESDAKVVEKPAGEKKEAFECSVCGKVCSSQWHLDKHSGTHEKKVESKEKPKKKIS